MLQIALYKNDELIANVPVTAWKVWTATGVPYAVRRKVIEFAIGNTTEQRYGEWFWNWKV